MCHYRSDSDRSDPVISSDRISKQDEDFFMKNDGSLTDTSLMSGSIDSPVSEPQKVKGHGFKMQRLVVHDTDSDPETSDYSIEDSSSIISGFDADTRLSSDSCDSIASGQLSVEL